MSERMVFIQYYTCC